MPMQDLPSTTLPSGYKCGEGLAKKSKNILLPITIRTKRFFLLLTALKIQQKFLISSKELLLVAYKWSRRKLSFNFPSSPAKINDFDLKHCILIENAKTRPQEVTNDPPSLHSFLNMIKLFPSIFFALTP
jgi:hypothetical protein